MNKIKRILTNRLFLIPLFVISIFINITYLFNTIFPIRNSIMSIGSTPPYDRSGTTYLAHGVIAFKNKQDQPKNTLQINTYYIDTITSKVYSEEFFIMDSSFGSIGRYEMDIVSFDTNTKILTLSGNGWEKVIIDTEKKKVIEATDSTGDVVYLKSSWEL